jgi:hypothetical protein
MKRNHVQDHVPVSPDKRDTGTKPSTTKQPPHSDFFAQKVPKVPPMPVNSLIYNELQLVGLSEKVPPKSHKSHRPGNVSRWSSSYYVFFYKLITNAFTIRRFTIYHFNCQLSTLNSQLSKSPTHLEEQHGLVTVLNRKS